MNRTILVGDLHGDFSKLSHLVQKSHMTENDVMVVLGDFGFIWNGSWKRNMEKINKIVPGRMFVVLGNHENYDLISQLPIAFQTGTNIEGEVYVASDKVWIARTGGNYTINELRCFVVNGADSIDKCYRVEGESWWPQECLTYDQVSALTYQIYGHYDLMLSHCTARQIVCSMWPQMGMDNVVSPMEHYLNYFYSEVDFDNAYFGHYHYDKDLDKYHCLWEEFKVI